MQIDYITTLQTWELEQDSHADLDVVCQLTKVSWQVMPAHSAIGGAEGVRGKVGQIFHLFYNCLHLHSPVACFTEMQPMYTKYISI